jgi:hypothetical protein
MMPWRSFSQTIREWPAGLKATTGLSWLLSRF